MTTVKNLDSLINQKMAYADTLTPHSYAWILANDTITRLIANRQDLIKAINQR